MGTYSTRPACEAVEASMIADGHHGNPDDADDIVRLMGEAQRRLADHGHRGPQGRILSVNVAHNVAHKGGK